MIIELQKRTKTTKHTKLNANYQNILIIIMKHIKTDILNLSIILLFFIIIVIVIYLIIKFVVLYLVLNLLFNNNSNKFKVL